MARDDKGLRFTKTHEWARVEGDTAVVGISDHAQHELGDITFVDLPAAGRQLTRGGEAAAVESVKAASDIYSPVSGEVVDANQSLRNDPAAVNADPYGAGWMFKVRMSKPAELDSLMTAEQYAGAVGG